MIKCYCENCEKYPSNGELELQEMYSEGDYKWVCMICNTECLEIPIFNIDRE